MSFNLAAMLREPELAAPDHAHALSQLLTAERLGSYLRWSGGDVSAAFALGLSR